MPFGIDRSETVYLSRSNFCSPKACSPSGKLLPVSACTNQEVREPQLAMNHFPCLNLKSLFSLLVLALASVSANAADITFQTIWSKQTGAVIYGGIGIDSENVFAGGEDGILRSFDKLSGEEAWTFEAEGAIASGVSTDDLRAYLHTRDGVVHGVDKKTGEGVWQFSTLGERRWDYWDYYLSTPIPDDRQVYFGSGDHHVYALDKRSGQLRWKVPTGNIVHGDPAISGERVIVGGFDGKVYAIDRGTGQVMWTFKTVGNAYFRNGEIPGSASVRDGMVYVGGRDYNIYALLEETGTGAWNDRTPSWIVGQPLALEEDLIIVNSDGARVTSYNRLSGQENWSYKNSYNMFAGAQPLGNDHLAVASLDGRITILDRADGSQAAVFETEGSRENHDQFFNEDGTVDYSGITNLDELSRLYDRQLAELGGIPGKFAVEGNVIYFATASGEIAAVRVNGITIESDP